jgi:transcriptional regulator with PAS, ATPase and Fis domain
MLEGELLYRTRDKHVMLGQSEAMKGIAEKVMDVSDSMATVLILGESGTGKELTAHAIHLTSARKDEPFLTVNCPSIPEDLFESEMFGHRRGAFTGAVETRGGYVEAARGGTLFLDEIGDLPLKSQAKILRLLEDRTYLPVGENRQRTADVRIVAATNQSLEGLVKKKKFREDLYYRLNVCTITQPPLRERKEDVPLLALYFVLQFASEMGKSIDGIDDETLQTLAAMDYPGNVRELRNLMESSVIHCKHPGMLRRDDLAGLTTPIPGPDASGAWPIPTLKFEEVERQLYEEALRRTQSNVSAAARLLGLSRGKLRRRLGALKMDPEEA